MRESVWRGELSDGSVSGCLVYTSKTVVINHSSAGLQRCPGSDDARKMKSRSGLINTAAHGAYGTGNCCPANANTECIMAPTQPSSTYEEHLTDKLSIFIYNIISERAKKKKKTKEQRQTNETT